MIISPEKLSKQLELLGEEYSNKKTRIDVDGTSGENDFFVIVNGSVEFYTELFTESFASKQPVVITSATSGSKIIINPNNVFNVSITETIEKDNQDE